MIALLIIGLISSVCASPHFNGSWHSHDHEHHHSHHGHGWHVHNHSHFDNNNYIHADKSLTDFNKTIKDLNNTLTDFHKRIKDLDNMITGLSQHVLAVVSQEGVVGNEYIITVPLSGFERKDIIVNAREGYVSIQANHKYSEGNENIYSTFRILPATVDLNGKWTYEGGVLKIMFPLKEGIETQTVRVIRTEPTTSSGEDLEVFARGGS